MIAAAVKRVPLPLRVRVDLDALECLGCGEMIPLTHCKAQNPERVASAKERLEAQHASCWEYGDEEIAREARRYYSLKARRMAEALRVLGV